MPGSLKFLLQVVVGVWFVFWLDNASLWSPYKMWLLSYHWVYIPLSLIPEVLCQLDEF
ncbi:hypothetical protein M758_UG062300 [Ceratodon purpureus]|nr:hypothetical protein M758_UG062300 [Ceratodon purpureus]